jgi:hypothetical protein
MPLDATTSALSHNCHSRRKTRPRLPHHRTPVAATSDLAVLRHSHVIAKRTQTLSTALQFFRMKYGLLNFFEATFSEHVFSRHRTLAAFSARYAKAQSTLVELFRHRLWPPVCFAKKCLHWVSRHGGRRERSACPHLTTSHRRTAAVRGSRKDRPRRRSVVHDWPSVGIRRLRQPGFPNPDQAVSACMERRNAAREGVRGHRRKGMTARRRSHDARSRSLRALGPDHAV